MWSSVFERLTALMGAPKLPRRRVQLRLPGRGPMRVVYDKASGSTRPLDSRIATLGFGYNLALRMDEPDRLENPLGFQVTRYRVDADFAPVPPLETEPEVMSISPPEEGALNPPPAMGDGVALAAQAEGTR